MRSNSSPREALFAKSAAVVDCSAFALLASATQLQECLSRYAATNRSSTLKN